MSILDINKLDARQIQSHSDFIKFLHQTSWETSDGNHVLIKAAESPIDNKERTIEISGLYRSKKWEIFLCDPPFLPQLNELIAPWTLEELPHEWRVAALHVTLSNFLTNLFPQNELLIKRIETNASQMSPSPTFPIAIPLEVIITTSKPTTTHSANDYYSCLFSCEVGLDIEQFISQSNGKTRPQHNDFPASLIIGLPLIVGTSRLTVKEIDGLAIGDILTFDDHGSNTYSIATQQKNESKETESR